MNSNRVAAELPGSALTDPGVSTALQDRIETDSPSRATASVRVAILLGTVNGEQFIEQQLQSFAAQTHRNWVLYVSDDGSQDRTLAIVREFAQQVGSDRVQIRQGPRQGFAANFLAMACDPSIDADYFAFSDQDDVWLPKKIERALAHLRELSANRSGLYGGRTRYVDVHNRDLGLSPQYRRAPDFRNAMVQSIMGGNTMVLNRQARSIVMAAGPLQVVAHDWWFYQLISGCGGFVFYDPEPMVLYRQHSDNVIGSNTGIKALWYRSTEMIRGRFARWNSLNMVAMSQVAPLLLQENRAALAAMAQGRGAGVTQRIKALRTAGAFRQTGLGNAGLWFAALMNRL